MSATSGSGGQAQDAQRSVLLIIGGGIAAYKSLSLIRLFKTAGYRVRCVLTAGGAEFITPLSVASLSGETCHTELFDLTEEVEMGHIELSRASDLIICAPATASLMAKAASGIADDLATTLLLATDTRVLLAPAMNVRMWTNPATERNVAQLLADGCLMVGPDDGEMACGEYGPGRMAEPEAIFAAAEAALRDGNYSQAWKGEAPAGQRALRAPGPLSGKRLLVTAGPTHEPLDPVRYVANRSSGKQGYAIAKALVEAGADVTLVSGPTSLGDVPGAKMVRVQTAREMLAVCEQSLPVDCAIMCAAVADYRPDIETPHKIKKERGGLSSIPLAENPDILKTIAQMKEGRPPLVIGFAAETDDVVGHAEAKRMRKGCDWIVANDVSPEKGVMGGDANTVILLTDDGQEDWETMSKDDVSRRLADRIGEALAAK